MEFTDGEGMRKIAVDYYKNFLCSEPKPGIGLRDDFFLRERESQLRRTQCVNLFLLKKKLG